MATGSDLITQARRLLVDVSDESYSDAELLSYLNEAIARFAAETHCKQKLLTMTATGNAVTFADILADSEISSLAQEIIAIGKIMLSDGTNYNFLPKAPLSETGSLQAATGETPTQYTLFGDSIIFDLDPSVSGLSNTIQIYCSYVPVEIAAGDDVPIQVEWHFLLVKYIEFCARVVMRDAGQANGALNIYENGKVKAAEHYIKLLEG